MTAQLPVVSIVMAAQDEERNVARAVASLIAQTLADWELIVVDDCSMDSTVDVIQSFGDERIKVIRNGRPTGLPASLNRATRLVRADLIARQDADDISLPERLERQVDFLREHPHVAVTGTRWIEVDSSGTEVRPRARFISGPLANVLADFNPITHTTAVFRRQTFELVGGYDEGFAYAADYDLWLRMASAGAEIWNLPEPLAIRTMSGSNMSAHRERAQILEELRIRWRDLRRGDPWSRYAARQAARMTVRAAILLAPLALRRAMRRRQGKAE